MFWKKCKIIAREFSTLPYTLRDQPAQLTCTKEKPVSADYFRKFPFLCKNKKNMIELKYLQNCNSCQQQSISAFSNRVAYRSVDSASDSSAGDPGINTQSGHC